MRSLSASFERNGFGPNRLGVILRLSRAAGVHLPDGYNAASLIDAETASKGPFERKLAYQFVSVKDEGRWLLISYAPPFPTLSLNLLILSNISLILRS